MFNMRKLNCLKFVLMCSPLVLTSCIATNPYSKFYNDATQGMRLKEIRNGSAKVNYNPKVIQGIDIGTDTKAMLENGYCLLGYSTFNGGDADERQAIRHAMRIGADAIVLYSSYSHTVSGALPITIPTIESSTTQSSGQASGSGMIYGSGGMANYSGSARGYGSSQTTTYGQQTTMMPFSVRRYDYHASFWLKNTNVIVFGAIVRDLSADERKAIGQNNGVAIIAVVKRTPAFTADFFEGDIITKTYEAKVVDQEDWITKVRFFEGKQVVVTVIRKGQEMKKEVTFNTRSESSPSSKEIEVEK